MLTLRPSFPQNAKFAMDRKANVAACLSLTDIMPSFVDINVRLLDVRYNSSTLTILEQ